MPGGLAALGAPERPEVAARPEQVRHRAESHRAEEAAECGHDVALGRLEDADQDHGVERENRAEREKGESTTASQHDGGSSAAYSMREVT